MSSTTTTTDNTLPISNIVIDSSGGNDSIKYFQISCAQCRTSHRKCDRRLPACTACAQRNLNCCYKPPKKRQRSSTSQNHTNNNNNNNNSNNSPSNTAHDEQSGGVGELMMRPSKISRSTTPHNYSTTTTTTTTRAYSPVASPVGSTSSSSNTASPSASHFINNNTHHHQHQQPPPSHHHHQQQQQHQQNVNYHHASQHHHNNNNQYANHHHHSHQMNQQQYSSTANTRNSYQQQPQQHHYVNQQHQHHSYQQNNYNTSSPSPSSHSPSPSYYQTNAQQQQQPASQQYYHPQTNQHHHHGTQSKPSYSPTTMTNNHQHHSRAATSHGVESGGNHHATVTPTTTTIDINTSGNGNADDTVVSLDRVLDLCSKFMASVNSTCDRASARKDLKHLILTNQMPPAEDNDINLNDTHSSSTSSSNSPSSGGGHVVSSINQNTNNSILKIALPAGVTAITTSSSSSSSSSSRSPSRNGGGRNRSDSVNGGGASGSTSGSSGSGVESVTHAGPNAQRTNPFSSSTGLAQQGAMMQNATTGIPPCIPPNAETFEFRVNKTLFYSLNAVVLHHAPIHTSASSTNQPAADFYQSVQRRLKSVLDGCIVNDTTDIMELTKNFTRIQLRQTADDMFRTARETLLHPEIYPYLATNPKLAHACINIVNYLFGKRIHVGEARLFLSNVKVFLQQTRNARYLNVNHYSGDAREHMEKIKETTAALMGTYYGTKMIMEMNNDYKDFSTYEGLRRLVDLSIRAYENVSIAMKYQETPNGFQRVRNLLKVLDTEPEGIDRLNKFVSVCKDLLSDNNWIPHEERKPNSVTFYRLSALGFQLYIANIESLRTTYDQETIASINRLKLNIANQIAKYCFENLQIFLIGGGVYIELYLHACRTHAARVRALLGDMNASHAELRDILAYLQAEIQTLDALYEKYETGEFAQMSKELKMLAQSISPQIMMLKELAKNNATTTSYSDSGSMGSTNVEDITTSYPYSQQTTSSHPDIQQLYTVPAASSSLMLTQQPHMQFLSQEQQQQQQRTNVTLPYSPEQGHIVDPGSQTVFQSGNLFHFIPNFETLETILSNSNQLQELFPTEGETHMDHYLLE